MRSFEKKYLKVVHCLVAAILMGCGMRTEFENMVLQYNRDFADQPMDTDDGWLSDPLLEEVGKNTEAIESDCVFSETLLKNDQLSKLRSCKVVKGNIDIRGCNDCILLDHIRDVDIVKGDIDIYRNLLIEQVGSFMNLQIVEGNLCISMNPNLTDAGIFHKLRYVGGDVEVHMMNDNYAQAEMPKMPKLERIGGNLSLVGRMIEDIGDFSSLKQIRDGLTISSTYRLSVIEGMDKLDSTGGVVNFSFNRVLQRITGLSSLEKIGGKLEIKWNPLLHDISGLNNVETIEGDLWVSGNSSLNLEKILALEKLKTIKGNVTFCENGWVPNKKKAIRSLKRRFEIDGMIYISNEECDSAPEVTYHSYKKYKKEIRKKRKGNR